MSSSKKKRLEVPQESQQMIDSKEQKQPLKQNIVSSWRHFDENGKLDYQQSFLQDNQRTEFYNKVCTKYRSMFTNRVVVDVGAGTGFLSLLAAKAGAKKVYAVEASGMAKYSKDLILGNSTELKKRKEKDWSKNVEVINANIEDVELFENKEKKADILISVPVGDLLVNGRMIESYVIARDRFLRPNGLMIPSMGRIYMAPFSDKQLHEEIAAKALFWHQNSYYGVNLNSLHSSAFEGYFSQPVVDNIEPECLLSEASIHTIDFTKVKKEELHKISCPFKFKLLKQGVGIVHGLACWFDLRFKSCRYTTSPSAKPTHWKQVLCVLQQPVYAGEDQVINGTFEMVATEERSYELNLTMSVEGQGLSKSSGKLLLNNSWFRNSNNEEEADERALLRDFEGIWS